MRLELKSLSVTYVSSTHQVSALRDVSIAVEAGQTLGVVGESGSGKSTMGLAIIRLLPSGVRTEGQILLDGDDLLRYPESRMREVRGKTIGMVFQDSLAALNPVYSIRAQLVETLRRHNPGLGRKAAIVRAGDALEEMGMSRDRIKGYPHEFSGGMRQRVMIAAALAPNPSFLIADESTSDLDTISQRQILDLLAEVQSTRGLGLIVVSHDLGVIYRLCEKVAVLYRGDLVEYGRTEDVLLNPVHDYTKGLVRIAAKKLDEAGRLYTLPSRVAAQRDAREREIIVGGLGGSGEDALP